MKQQKKYKLKKGQQTYRQTQSDTHTCRGTQIFLQEPQTVIIERKRYRVTACESEPLCKISVTTIQLDVFLALRFKVCDVNRLRHRPTGVCLCSLRKFAFELKKSRTTLYFMLRVVLQTLCIHINWTSECCNLFLSLSPTIICLSFILVSQIHCS